MELMITIVSKLVYSLFMGPTPSFYRGHNPCILSISRTSQVIYQSESKWEEIKELTDDRKSIPPTLHSLELT